MSDPNVNITQPFYEAAPLSAFSDRGGDYANYRPSYPADAVDTILKNLGEPSRLKAADVGAGTGIGSRLLAERGLHVAAIEPNASMRQAANPHSFVEFHDATAEATYLPEASIDLITSFQAFHWFNPKPTLLEFRRILKPSGRLALIWSYLNNEDKCSAEFKHIVKVSMNHRPARGEREKLLSSTPYFFNVRCDKFTHRHELDLRGMIGYAQSKSFVPREGAAYQQLISDLNELHACWADKRGLVSFVYSTTVYLAEPQLYSLGGVHTLLQRVLPKGSWLNRDSGS